MEPPRGKEDDTEPAVGRRCSSNVSHCMHNAMNFMHALSNSIHHINESCALAAVGKSGMRATSVARSLYLYPTPFHALSTLVGG